MKVDSLHISGAHVFAPRVLHDDRGSFLEWFRTEPLTELLGYPLHLAQANWSTSRRGVLRGVHYADVPPGQAKYVTCVRGAVLDAVVDLRVGSRTFGDHELVTLDSTDPRAVFLDVGLGHAFQALTDEATVLYLCSTGYNPTAEHGVHPLDPALGIGWAVDVEPVLSPKDAAAPTLEQARLAGALPRYDTCRGYYESLRESGA